MQTELLVSALQADFTRVATIQFTNSVGQASMAYQNSERQHTPTGQTLMQMPKKNLPRSTLGTLQKPAHLANRLAETPEPVELARCLTTQLLFGR